MSSEYIEVQIHFPGGDLDKESPYRVSQIIISVDYQKISITTDDLGRLVIRPL